MRSKHEYYLIRTQQDPAWLFDESAQPADKGNGLVVDMGGLSSLGDAKQLLDELVMCGEQRGVVHNWREYDSPTESACGSCGLGIDKIKGAALFFSGESCRISWSEWRAGVRNLTDEELLIAMTDADAALLTHGREGWVDSKRPKYALLGELRVLMHQIDCRGLDWWNWEGRSECFRDSVTRKSSTFA